MKGYLIYEKEAAEKNQSYIKEYIEEGRKVGLEITLIYYENVIYGISDGAYYLKYSGIEFKRSDFFINRCRDYLLGRQLEWMGHRVFNRAIISEIGNNKAKTYQAIIKTKVPVVPSIFVRNNCLENYLYKNSKIGETLVVKSVGGHGGNQVEQFQLTGKEERDKEEVCKIIERMNGDHVVIQPMVKGKGQDLRVYVIGNEIVASVLRTAKKGFRSNYSLGGKVELYNLTKKEESLVNRILDCFSFDYVGIDFIIDEQGTLLFNEIEDVVGARMLYECSDINIVKRYVSYIANCLTEKMVDF